MSWTEIGNTVCPIARSLAVVGDRWTLLIVRELFLGSRRFEEFQVQTGISSHLLSTRLKRLVEDEIVERRQYSERPVRFEYRLTDKGLDLYPLLLSLKGWGEKWGGLRKGAAPALSIVHDRCGHETGLKLSCPSCGEPFGPRDASVKIGDKFLSERRSRRNAG